MRISIVIPTYNRGAALRATLSALLANDPSGLERIEIIVVDDGSTVPASAIVNTFAVSPPFELRSIRQANAGPASARNAGFRSSDTELVLFVDDDIICGTDLVLKHVEAHGKRPGAVIFGRSPFLSPPVKTPLYSYLTSLGNDLGENAQDEFVESPLVASGHLSVEKPMFSERGAVYSEHLSTPAAEEFELSYRLRAQGVPLLMATQIVAVHNHSVVLESICRQQYTYGVGCAEAWERCPATRELPELRHIVSPYRYRGLRSTLRSAVNAHGAPRRLLLEATRLVEAWSPIRSLLPLLYRVTIGLHFSSGIQHGLRLFSRENGPRPVEHQPQHRPNSVASSSFDGR